MTGGAPLPEELKRPLHSTMKAVEMQEVPLVIVDGEQQWAYLQVVASLLRGVVVNGSAPDALAQTLHAVERPGYLVLVLDEEIERDLAELIRHYLIVRDVMDAADALLERRFGADRIHDEHRLILVCDSEIRETLERWLLIRVTAIAVH